MSEILGDVVSRLRARGADGASIRRATVGDSVVLVEVDADADSGDGDGRTVEAGIAHRPKEAPPVTGDGADASRGTGGPDAAVPDVTTMLDAAAEPAYAAGAGTAAGSEGAAAADGPGLLRRALGIATVNALSAPHVTWRAGDPMALLADDVDRIATVGAFGPAFRKFADVEVRVIEREPIDDVPVSVPESVRTRTFTPAETDAAMDGVDVVFVTGSAFIYGGVDRYLEAAPAAATVVVIGATASFLPEPLFDAGADVVAGARVTGRRGVRRAVRRGACGTALHEAGVEKVYAAATRPRGVRLDPTTDGSREPDEDSEGGGSDAGRRGRESTTQHDTAEDL
ncbi:MAG: Rossmann-like domain-containing protein [Haloquadratum sp.]